MKRFRKKSVVVKAEQWFPGKSVEGVHDPIPGELPHHYLKEADRVRFLNPGDWVVGEDGHFRRYCPTEFEAMFTEIPDPNDEL